MRYIVADFYENPFGENIYIAHSKEDLREFCDMYEKDTDGECLLKVRIEI